MWIYIIGLLAQCFFSARIIVQWFLSEKEKRVVSPVSYWICSLLGSYLLFIYGWLREDFAIILGQVLSYYIYIWNLSLKGVWKRINIFVKFILLFTPVVAVFAVVKNIPVFVDSFLWRDGILTLQEFKAQVEKVIDSLADPSVPYGEF